MLSPSNAIRSPTVSGTPRDATHVIVLSDSYRLIWAPIPPSSRLTSSATVANTAVGSRATSVATRRNAACSSTSRCTSPRACTFAIAVATSSVKAAILASVSAASG
jgi:hypothetical protein